MDKPTKISNKRGTGVLLCLILLLSVTWEVSCSPARIRQGLFLSDLTLPPGFTIDVYASNVENAPSLALGENGTLFVATRSAGRVYAVLDQDRDNKADKVITVAKGLNMPNGVAFKSGALFIAEVNRVSRYDDIESRLTNPPKPVIVRDDFPKDRHHGWKFIRFGPESSTGLATRSSRYVVLPKTCRTRNG